MDAVLGDTQFSGNVIICYSCVCHEDIMNFNNGLMCVSNVGPLRVSSCHA